MIAEFESLYLAKKQRKQARKQQRLLAEQAKKAREEHLDLLHFKTMDKKNARRQRQIDQIYEAAQIEDESAAIEIEFQKYEI